jgi:cytochrome P450
MIDSAVVVQDFSTARTILRQTDCFSSSPAMEFFGGILGHTALPGLDRPEHHRERAVFTAAISRFLSAQDGLRSVVTDALAQLPQVSQPLDDTCRHVAAAVVGAMIGHPGASERIAAFAVDMSRAQIHPRDALRASREIRALCCSGEWRGNGFAADWENVSDEQAVTRTRVLVFAGVETTARALVGLCRHLALADQNSDPDLRSETLRQSIEESLRLSGAVGCVYRRAIRESSVVGELIPANTLVAIDLAAANRDPCRFDRPGEFRPLRSERSHLAFGYGPHRCPGRGLARLVLFETSRQLFGSGGKQLLQDHPNSSALRSPSVFDSPGAVAIQDNLQAEDG